MLACDGRVDFDVGSVDCSAACVFGAIGECGGEVDVGGILPLPLTL